MHRPPCSRLDRRLPVKNGMFLGLMRVLLVWCRTSNKFSRPRGYHSCPTRWKMKLNSWRSETKLSGKILTWEDATNRPKELPVLRIVGDLCSFGQDLLAKDVGAAVA